MARWLLVAASLAAILAGCVPAAALSPTAPPLASAVATIAVPTATATTPVSRRVVTRPVPVLPTLRRSQGDLHSQMLDLERTMPRAGSGALVAASDEERVAISRLVELLQAGDSQGANGIAATLGCEIIRYVDHGDNNAESLLLREQKPVRKGWGMYLFRRAATNDLIVEAPHPLSDEGTADVALDAYRALQARALLVAGAHREASADEAADVAHNPNTVFQAIHETLASTGTPVVLQIHGFASQKHPGYPQLVLGGEGQGSALLLDRLAQAVQEKAEIVAGVCGGGAWEALCGESNVQAQSMRRGIFVHLELAEPLRERDRSLMTALQTVFGDH